jgi:UrcA family protein
LAQDTRSHGIRPAANPSEEVVVVAPYLVHKKTLLGTQHRLPVYSVTVERNVSYADIDLGTPSGATELQNRVDDAAKEVCAELDRKYPKSVYPPISDTRHCVETASKEGQARAQEVIAAYMQ